MSVRRERSLLTLILLLAACTCPLAHGQFWPGEYFRDTFEDGNHRDSEPTFWRHGDRFLGTDQVVDGDLLIQNVRAFSSSVPSSPDGYAYWTYEDVSLRTQVRILDTTATHTSVGFYGRSLSRAAYFGGIRQTGEIVLGESNTNSSIISSEILQTDLDPTTKDVLLQMDFVGDLISLTAWDPDEARPAPQLTIQDSTLPSGAVAVYADAAGGAADFAFRWVEVAPVPEPASLLLGILGGVLLLGYSRPVHLERRYVDTGEKGDIANFAGKRRTLR